MSSVVAEANSHLSTQTARPKTGQGNSSSGNDGFSGLVDENLAATADSEAVSADRPRQGAREGSVDPQPGRRTGVHARPRNQTEPTRQSSAEPSPNDARAVDASAETSLTPPAADAVKTGPVTADAATEPVETAAQADAEETPAPTPAPSVSGAAVVATAVTVQIELANDAPTSVIESGEAITVTNPPATIVAPPAETAANALLRVANDTGEAPTATGAMTDPQAQADTDVQTPPPAATEATPATAATDVNATETIAEADASAEAAVRVETATADAQLEVKAQTELSAAAKSVDAATPEETAQQVDLTARPEIKPAEKPEDAAPEQPLAKPESRTDRRIDANAADPHPGKPAEIEKPPARPAAHEPPATNAAHTPSSENAQPAGYGATQVAPLHVQNMAAANLTVIPAASVAVPISGLAVQIAANVQVGRSRFEIRLDPPELGRIDVRLDVDRQGQVTSHLIVEKSATLDLLRRDAQQLERALQDAGLKTSDNGLQFSLRNQQEHAGRNDDNGGRNAHRLIVTDEETVAVETAGRSYGRMVGQRGGIDIRV